MPNMAENLNTLVLRTGQDVATQREDGVRNSAFVLHVVQDDINPSQGFARVQLNSESLQTLLVPGTVQKEIEEWNNPEWGDVKRFSYLTLTPTDGAMMEGLHYTIRPAIVYKSAPPTQIGSSVE